jgi:uncharacterized protein (TIGR02284 family)
MSHRFTIDALKELIAARRDAEQGLRICIEHVRDRRLRTLLMSHLHECAQAQQELQSLVRLLGGELAPAVQESATIRRRWADLRASLLEASEAGGAGEARDTLACNEDGVILDECERGESRALEVYRNALDDPLPGLVRAVVLRQFEDVMTNHDQIRDLRSQPSLRADLGAGNGAQAGPH